MKVTYCKKVSIVVRQLTGMLHFNMQIINDEILLVTKLSEITYLAIVSSSYFLAASSMVMKPYE